MPEEYLVRHCAPTLAGMKSGSMFLCPFRSHAELRGSIRRMNGRLRGKGLRILPLRCSQSRALIYIYRPGMLAEDLSCEEAVRLLGGMGYAPGSCEKSIAQLICRLREQDDFPHEIGLFLGYPCADVLGFIENKACGSKCTGCWKVYGDAEAARKTFAKYKKCTQIYWDRWNRGTSLERLTVPC